MALNIIEWLLAKFKSEPEPKMLLPKSTLVNFELSEVQSLQVREIFECALRSENSETGAQECLGCGVATHEEMQHESGCIVGHILGMLPVPKEEACEVCPHCGSDLEE